MKSGVLFCHLGTNTVSSRNASPGRVGGSFIVTSFSVTSVTLNEHLAPHIPEQPEICNSLYGGEGPARFIRYALT
jgi:hypothetical protein